MYSENGIQLAHLAILVVCTVVLLIASLVAASKRCPLLESGAVDRVDAVVKATTARRYCWRLIAVGLALRLKVKGLRV